MKNKRMLSDVLVLLLCVLLLIVLIIMLFEDPIDKNFVIILGVVNLCAILYMAYTWFWEKKIKAHNFDMENPLIDNVTISEFHSLNNNTIFKELHLHGWVCKNCGKVLWLDKEDMKNLPKSMKYCK